jgi:NADPH:quinone reductase-like Zn-dependent oxidoreductase
VGFNLLDFYHQELSLHGVDSLAHGAAQVGPLLDRLGAGFARGALQVAPPKAFKLTDAVTAYAEVAAGTPEKVVLVP